MSEAVSFRVGQGIDIHRFVNDRPLYLGNVLIPSEVGLEGHSDADVLLHAVIDAVCGAVGLADIGTLFPNTDSSFRNISSSELFERVWCPLHELGWRLVNLDCTVLAERPLLQPHVSKIRSRLAVLFKSSPDRIGFKATTAERLGFLGRGEGMLASAVVLLDKEKILAGVTEL